MSARPSKMENTLLYAGQAKRNDKLVHILAYQNLAKSDEPNAMIIPFPTNTKMDEENIIDTSEFKNFLKDISNASKKQTLRRLSAFELNYGCAAIDNLAKVFDVGSYTVILADRIGQIPEALKRVPENKRPEISKNLLFGLLKFYQKQPIAICCWNGKIEAEPLLWWYEPNDPNTLFLPTMDAHDGNAPKIEDYVDTDHIISAGTSNEKGGNKVNYKDQIPEQIKELLPKYVYGSKLPRKVMNGDIFIKTGATYNDDAWNGSPTWVRKGWDKITSEGIMNGWS